jgi:hypothetical protein
VRGGPAGLQDLVVAGEVGVGPLREAVLACGAESRGATIDPEAVVRRFGRVATAEVAAACDMPVARANADLWHLALEWRIRPERVLGGELWTPL